MLGARTARTTHYGMTMNTGLSTMHLSDTRKENLCFVCAYPTVEHCFCKIHRTEGGPMRICCPDCVDQYHDASRGPLEFEEQERRAFVNRVEMFIGVDKPWSAITPTIPSGRSNS
jgi:hypothetical protein